MPTITGTDGPDYLVGPGSGDTIVGGSGNDTIVAGGPGGRLTGGSGADTFVFAPGYTNGATITDWSSGDRIVFSTLPVAYRITAAVNFNFGFADAHADAAAKLAAGFQIVVEAYGANGSNVAVFVDSQNNRTIGDSLVFPGSDLSAFSDGTFIGGGGSTGPSGSQSIGDSGPNTLTAAAGNDTLSGRAGHDVLVGGAGDNVLFGEDGNDTLTGGQGNDLLEGGEGGDTVRFANAASGVTVDLRIATAQQTSASEGRDTIRNVENVEGSPFNDRIVGGTGSNTLFGGAGDDTLSAAGLGGAPDTLSGGSGANVFDLGSPGHSPAAGALSGHLERLDRITDWHSGDVLRFPDVAATVANYVELNATSYDDAYARAMAAARGGAIYVAAQIGSDVVVFDPRFALAVLLTGARLTDISADNIRGSAALPAPPAPAQHGTFPLDSNSITGPFVVGPNEIIVLRESPPKAGIHAALYLDPQQGQPDPTFRNQVNIEVKAATINSVVALYVGTSSFWSENVIVNDGRIYVESSVDIPFYSGTARGIWATSWSPDIMNRGIIEVHGDAFASAITSWDLAHNGVPWTLTNADTGKIIVGARGQADAVYAANGGLVINHGLIQVTALNIDEYTGAWGIKFPNGHGEVVNYRTIEAGSPNGGVYTASIELGPYEANTIINYGIIAGKLAISSLDNKNGPGNTKGDLVENYGTINGESILNEGADTFINGGIVKGAIDLGSENDTYDGRFGSVSGMVSGGQGSDSLAGGASFDNFQGNQGNDTASGGPGDDWVVGGRDSDLLYGDAGNDLVYGNLGSDTCHGSDGNDTIRGGQDNDVVSGGAGADFVSGDKGDDTMIGGAGADIFHTFGDAGIDRVTDFNLAQGDRVQLDPGTQYTLAQVGADTVISMTGGGQMTLVSIVMSSLTPGWIFGA